MSARDPDFRGLRGPSSPRDPRAAGRRDQRRPNQGVRSAPIVLGGTPNFLAKYFNTADVGDSAVYESGGMAGIGTRALDARNAEPAAATRERHLREWPTTRGEKHGAVRSNGAPDAPRELLPIVRRLLRSWLRRLATI